MGVAYWPDVDILDIKLNDSSVSESDEISEGIIADYDGEGHIVALEILDASERVTDPQNMIFESMGQKEPASLG